MASFARRRSPAAAWSVDDASTFAAQKEFKLLQLLSTDKKAFAAARRLGLFSQKPQPQQAQTARSTASRTKPRVQPAAGTTAPRLNARKRRSAARSAQHHAQLQLQVYRTCIAVLYLCRLRRRCRARRLHAHLADLELLEGSSTSGDSGDPPSSHLCALSEKPSSKRAYRSSSSASSSAAAPDSSSRASLPGGFYHARCPPVLLQPGGTRRQRHKATPAPPYANRV